MPRCPDCSSRYGIREFIQRVREDLGFADELNEVMSQEATQAVGQFLCQNSYSATATEFADTMLSEIDNPRLSNLPRLLAAWGYGSAASEHGSEKFKEGGVPT